MRFYISDLHFYHEALLTKMDQRGFADCDAMHEYIIDGTVRYGGKMKS